MRTACVVLLRWLAKGDFINGIIGNRKWWWVNPRERCGTTHLTLVLLLVCGIGITTSCQRASAEDLGYGYDEFIPQLICEPHTVSIKEFTVAERVSGVTLFERREHSQSASYVMRDRQGCSISLSGRGHVVTRLDDIALSQFDTFLTHPDFSLLLSNFYDEVFERVSVRCGAPDDIGTTASADSIYQDCRSRVIRRFLSRGSFWQIDGINNTHSDIVFFVVFEGSIVGGYITKEINGEAERVHRFVY